MISCAQFRKFALALPDAVEAPHFELTSFRVNKKIFATLCEKDARAMIKLTPDQQEVLVESEPKMFKRIPNSWGDQGATWLELSATDAQTVQGALRTAHTNVTAKKRRG